MNKKSFFLGVLTGVILSIAGLFVIGLAFRNPVDNGSFQYLEKPVSYENKKEASFKVLQTLDNAALATEASDESDNVYCGTAVLILGEDFYDDQIIRIKYPQRIGTYSYTTKTGLPRTVPIINGDIE